MIPKKTRDYIENSPVALLKLTSNGELCFALTTIVLNYAGGDLKKLNESIGTLETAKQDIFRRYLNPAAAQNEFDHGS
jgi:hypothetical protein